MYSKNSDCILCAFQIFGHILVTGQNVLLMLKTFRVHSKWRNIERHWKCILTALLLHSKIVLQHSNSIRNILVSFEGESKWQVTSNNIGILLLYPWSHSLHQFSSKWVFYSELLRQSGVMSIQPPPLLCQPWTCLISFGSSPLSFPDLLHISFEQVLLEDSNLE